MVAWNKTSNSKDHMVKMCIPVPAVFSVCVCVFFFWGGGGGGGVRFSI